MSSHSIIEASITTFRRNKQWADEAIVQVNDDQLRIPLHPETNSIAVIMKHVAGNLRSRWTNFLTEDGEKPWRDRDDEFKDTFPDRSEMLAHWERGWQCLFETLLSLTDDDLDKTITIRGEVLSVAEALQRSLGHTCYHVGQIVMVARCVCQSEWKVLTIARGGSTEFNATVWGSDTYKSK